MNSEKLSLDARIHAAQNDRLPLRTIIQVYILWILDSCLTQAIVDLLMSNKSKKLLDPYKSTLAYFINKQY